MGAIYGILDPYHAERVTDSLEGGALQDGLNLSMLPLLDALQRFFERENDDYWPIPVTGQYSWHRRRVSIGIRPPQGAASQRLIEVGAFLEEGFVETEDLNDAVRRRMALVLAPFEAGRSEDRGRSGGAQSRCRAGEPDFLGHEGGKETEPDGCGGLGIQSVG